MTTQWRAFRVAYDGRSYHGFQRQPDVSTVSDTLLDAFADLGVSSVPDQYTAAGRTDAGVSALAQTIACPVPAWLTPAAVNAHLPDSVVTWAMATVPEGFHATHMATSRTYSYYLYVDAAIDPDRLTAGAARLAGTHDFHNLTPDTTGTERTVRIDVTIEEPMAVLSFSSDGFPRQFVRRATTLLRRIATDEAPLSFIDRVLTDQPLAGPDGISPAPPEPLLLADVTYPDVCFTPADTGDALHEQFLNRHQQLHASAAVFKQIADEINPDVSGSITRF